jgi:hypothetical protein
LNQYQPPGTARFLARIARSLGDRREARPRGRPLGEARASVPGQSELEL